MAKKMNCYVVTLSDGSKYKVKATTAIAAKNKVVKSKGNGLYAVGVMLIDNNAKVFKRKCR